LGTCRVCGKYKTTEDGKNITCHHCGAVYPVKYKYGKTSRDEKLDPIQEEMVQAYCNPELINPKTGKHTLFSQKESYLITHPNEKKNDKSACAASTLQFSKAKIKLRMREILEEHGFGQSDRMEMLSGIGKGTSVRTQQRVDKAGNVVNLEIRPTYNESLRAIEIANKSDGTYKEAGAAANAANAMLDALRKKIMGGGK
jgi:hypothetical protein